jgi:hypothetical protein
MSQRGENQFDSFINTKVLDKICPPLKVELATETVR